MNRTDVHPLEALLLLVLLALDAAAVLLGALVALLLTLARWSPVSPAPAPIADGTAPALPAPVTAGSTPAPTAHPLQQLVLEPLQARTVAQLRQQARSAGLPRALTRNGTKAALVTALAATALA